MDAETLFPGALRPLYDAFIAAIADAGGADEEFTKTQVSMGLARKFAWLSPLTKTDVLLTLDLYEPHPDDRWRGILPLGKTKFTHQFRTGEPDEIARLARDGFFDEAREWGEKTRESDTKER